MWNFIKPSLPAQYVRLADIAVESSEHLFGDSVTDFLESLKKKKPNENTAEKSTRSAEEKETLLFTTTVKFQSLFQDPEDQGHYGRRPVQSQNYSNKYNNYNW